MALNMKATPEFRSKVEAAAARSGLSIAQEVERRLLASIEEDERQGDADQAEFLRGLKNVMDRVSRELDASWHADLDGWKIVRAAAMYMLEQVQPAATSLPAMAVDSGVSEALSDHAKDHAEWRARQRYIGTRVTELYLKQQVGGLSGEEKAEQSALVEEAAATREPPVPSLPAEQLTIWRTLRDRDTRIERANAGAVAMLPYKDRL